MATWKFRGTENDAKHVVLSFKLGGRVLEPPCPVARARANARIGGLSGLNGGPAV